MSLLLTQLLCQQQGLFIQWHVPAQGCWLLAIGEANKDALKGVSIELDCCLDFSQIDILIYKIYFQYNCQIEILVTKISKDSNKIL